VQLAVMRATESTTSHLEAGFDVITGLRAPPTTSADDPLSLSSSG
jgi:hypothetical protein